MMKLYVRKFIRSELGYVSGCWLGWRVLTLAGLALGLSLLPREQAFLGGGQANYNANPLLWAWVNFDGEHYLAIAREGYRPLTYFFFPLYPLMVRIAIIIFGNSREIANFALLGVVMSNVLFWGALVGLYFLAREEIGKMAARKAMLWLILFPTSFFFGSFYTESLFLFLAVWGFYFLKRGKLKIVGVLLGLASVTRIVGIAIVPAIVYRWWKSGNKLSGRWAVALAGAPGGLAAYMAYMMMRTGDAFEFLNNVGIYGEQRSSGFVLLPRVFYRYVFKIIPNLSSYWPSVWVVLLEMAVGLVFLAIIVLSFKKIEFGMWLYMAAGFLIPTLSGSFSSLPRYVLVLFPAFMVLGKWTEGLPRVVEYAGYGILLMCLLISEMMFVRGYWIA